ncbi:glycosyltransferase family 4 protein [Patescibacteria group bacterium]|nr:glycosyltransferase family 4 protein [Patescibacteria group bacterium]MBU4458758.1 glycosyltransferase family 4 protein [Patescibacteria group bacterium]MCG2696059.1 glycosyltransferase family 4 protein [Candidatus Portnoybacteria bacterium]
MRIGIEAHTIEKQEKLGAGGNYLSQILKEWSKLNPDEYQFILYFKDRIPQEKLLDSPVFTKKLVRTPIKSTALFYNIFMPLMARKDKLDILFLPFYMRPFFCFTPTITAIHDISFKVHPEWIKWNYKLPFRLLSRLAIKTSRAILACSEYTKKEIIKNYKISPEKIHTIYLAADENFNNQRNEQEIQKSKQKYGIDGKYLFYAGSIFNRRHVLESIKAFEVISEKNPYYQFLISGRDLTHPAQNIDKNNIVKRVCYIDKNDLKNIYQGAELFVWLSEYEGFGLPILEAMSCGTPVLTTEMTSLTEVVGDYPIWVNDPGNVEEIKEKMIKTLKDENLRKKMIEMGLYRASEFSWRKTAEETLKVLSNYAK